MKTQVSRARLLEISSLLVMGFLAVNGPAVAQDAGLSQQFDEMRNAFGLGTTRAPIDFTERPPLVVPPSNNLPPPSADSQSLGVNDPDIDARHRALSDSRRPVPPSDPGASAQGINGRAYLVDPPSGMRDPAAVAAAPTTDEPAAERKTHRRKAHKPAVQAAQ